MAHPFSPHLPVCTRSATAGVAKKTALLFSSVPPSASLPLSFVFPTSESQSPSADREHLAVRNPHVLEGGQTDKTRQEG